MVMMRDVDGDEHEPVRVIIHYDPDLREEDVTTVDGIPVTTPARTLLDLATCCDDRDLREALSTALRRNLTNRAELIEVMARYPRHAGLPRLKALLGA